MKLDFVITELDVGGAEKCLTSLAIHAKKCGHDVRVISLGSEPSSEQSILADKLKGESIGIHFLGGRKIWHFPIILYRLRKIIAKAPPELAQSFLFHANVASACIYPLFAIPLMGGVRVAEPRKWRHRIGRWAASKMNRVVCVSESILAWCRQVEKAPFEKLIVIPNGIETSQNGSRNLDTKSLIPTMPHGAPFLLFVGRIDYQKGVDQLMARADNLLKKLPDWHLVLIGDGPLLKGFQKDLDGMTERRRIHFLGWQPNPREWMAASQLVLLPTRFEGMPNVVLEAMSEGRTIVVTEAEGVQEILGDVAGGQLCGAGKFDDWEQRVLQLASEPETRMRLGEANRKRVESNYRLDDQLDAYLRLYSEQIRLLSGIHPTSPVE